MNEREFDEYACTVCLDDGNDNTPCFLRASRDSAPPTDCPWKTMLGINPEWKRLNQDQEAGPAGTGPAPGRLPHPDADPEIGRPTSGPAARKAARINKQGDR